MNDRLVVARLRGLGRDVVGESAIKPKPITLTTTEFMQYEHK